MLENNVSTPFHAIPPQEVFEILNTSSQGLNSKEVKKRQIELGKNILEQKKISKIKIFIRQFNNSLVYILFAASLISFSIGKWTDFFVINAIILINGLIAFWQELKAEYSIEALKKLTESKSKAYRDNELVLVNSSELVPGDFVVLHEGEMISADIRLTDSSGLMIDESSITGESIPILKDHTEILEEKALPYELKNTLLSGTFVVKGSGKGVVVKTGTHSYLASIAKHAEEKSPDTPLTRALNFFTKYYVLIVSILFFGLGVIGFLQNRSILELAYILLASLVSAAPEGLPIVITLVMVIGTLALSKKQTLVRYLPAVETLGSATVIASDKTGTITQGELVVKEYFSNDLMTLKTIAALCNDAEGGKGDPIDVALSDFIENFDEIRKQAPRKWSFPFDTKHRFMATINQIDHTETLFVKGAFEALKTKAADQKNLNELENMVEQFSLHGLRVLAFGKGVTVDKNPENWRIEIIGIIGFLDPPKTEVKEAIEFAKKAGIRVIMITGDHPLTAKAIAQQVSIWNDHHEILTGKEIDTLSEKEITHRLQSTSVLARVLPEQKYTIVKLLQKNKEVVAVTGDGVNDVPALKVADIGIAMGSGAEAAKNASKMVITDNNLKIIVEAIKNARVISDNIRKVIYYLLSTSMQEIFVISFSIFTSLTVPLTAIQILWINIVTDGVLDKAFPFAKAEGNVMARKPQKPEKQFFNRRQVVRILTFGFGMGILTFFLYLYILPLYPFKEVSTILFTSIVFAQWANGIQAQKEAEPFFKNLSYSFQINPYIYLGLITGIFLQLIVLYLIPSLFHVTPLSFEQWKYPIGSFLLAFAIVEIRKWVESYL